MSDGEHFLLVLTLCVSLATATWVGALMFGGVKLGPGCRYVVPVVGHPHVLACSVKPQPKGAP